MAKRLFDILCALMGLVILAPLLLVIAIWIKLDSEGSIFFRQLRIGLNGQPFRIHKFRTMTPNTESLGGLTVGNDMRITSAGKTLRK